MDNSSTDEYVIGRPGAFDLNGSMLGRVDDGTDDGLESNGGGKNKTSVTPEHRCMARTWCGGEGAQCSRKRCGGTDFCKTHGKEDGKQCKDCSNRAGDYVSHSHQWRHLGRIDQPKPMFMD